MATEKRLIYANEAVKAVTDIYCSTAGYRARERLWQAVEAVKEIPTVDAVEVVHGRWMFKNNPITDPKGYFIRIVCSECNLHTGQKSNFCPQCGAKMDKEET